MKVRLTTLLLNFTQERSGTIRHSIISPFIAFCVFRITISGGRHDMAAFYTAWAEYWLHVSCLGSYEQMYPRFIHWYAPPACDDNCKCWFYVQIPWDMHLHSMWYRGLEVYPSEHTSTTRPLAPICWTEWKKGKPVSPIPKVFRHLPFSVLENFCTSIIFAKRGVGLIHHSAIIDYLCTTMRHPFVKLAFWWLILYGQKITLMLFCSTRTSF